MRIEPPMLAEPSYPGAPVGRAPVTTTGQAPVASAEAGPPAIGGLPPVPPASAGDTPAPRRRRSTRAILAMGTAAAAVLIGGSVLVASLGTSGSHRNDADVATPTPGAWDDLRGRPAAGVHPNSSCRDSSATSTIAMLPVRRRLSVRPYSRATRAGSSIRTARCPTNGPRSCFARPGWHRRRAI